MKHKKPTRRTGRGARVERPATIEELAKLHASPNYQIGIAQVRAAEALRSAQQRYEFPRGIYRALDWALDRARGKKP
jgi:hypothetical protein